MLFNDCRFLNFFRKKEITQKDFVLNSLDNDVKQNLYSYEYIMDYDQIGYFTLLKLNNVKEIPKILNELNSDESFNEYFRGLFIKGDLNSFSDFNFYCDVILDNTNLSIINNINMNGRTLDIENNKIKSLNGFKQTGDLYLSGNPITNLDGFHFNHNYSFSFDGTINVSGDQKELINFLRKNNISYRVIQKKYRYL